MDNINPRVTVGVPVYNPDMKFLRECFESIKNQSYKNYEVMVMDDGSDNKEENKKMTMEYGFKYFYQKNGGIGAARNAIIAMMSKKSDYLGYLSYDDIYHPDYLKVMVETSKKKGGCILFSDIILINEKGEKIGEIKSPDFETYEDFCIACLAYAERDNMFVNFSTTFFPADIIRREPFDNALRYGEDLEFILRTALVKRCEYVHSPYFLVKVRMHAKSVTSKKMDEIPMNNAGILDKIYKQLEEEVR